MKNQLFKSILILVFLSCSEKSTVQKTEVIRKEALSSEEFKELKIAYNQYWEYGKSHNFVTLYKKYGDSIELSDSLMNYNRIRDSLVSVMKTKSKAFYAKYPSNQLHLDIDEFKQYLTDINHTHLK